MDIVILSSELLSGFYQWLVMEKNYKPATLLSLKQRIKQLSLYLNTKPFTLTNCREYIYYLKVKNAKPSNICIVLYAIRVFSEFLKTKYTFNDFSRDLPKAKVKPPPIETLTLEEIRLLMSAQRQYKYPFMKEFWDLLIAMLARTGRRVHEICDLKVKEINIEESSMLLPDPKNNTPILLPIPKDITVRIEKIIKNKSPNDYVFECYMNKGHPITPTSVRIELHKRAQIAGIKKPVYPHIFRHSLPVELLRRKVPLMVIKNIMGHKQLATTERYMHLVIDDLITGLSSHPLNEEGLSSTDIVEMAKKDLQKYVDMKKKNIAVILNLTAKSLTFSLKW